MKSFPKPVPDVILEMSGVEANALLRALHRAVNNATDKRDNLDVQRLGALVKVLTAATEGQAATSFVEP